MNQDSFLDRYLFKIKTRQGNFLKKVEPNYKLPKLIKQMIDRKALNGSYDSSLQDDKILYDILVDLHYMLLEWKNDIILIEEYLNKDIDLDHFSTIDIEKTHSREVGIKDLWKRVALIPEKMVINDDNLDKLKKIDKTIQFLFTLNEYGIENIKEGIAEGFTSFMIDNLAFSINRKFSIYQMTLHVLYDITNRLLGDTNGGQ